MRFNEKINKIVTIKSLTFWGINQMSRNKKNKQNKKRFAALLTACLMLVTAWAAAGTVQAHLWPDRDLFYGLTGDDVLSLQTALLDQGYEVGPLDGIFGAKTESAVLAYQSDYGLYVDGVAGNQTLSSLYGTSADTQQQAAAASSDTGTLSRTLSFGMTGSDVSTLQSILRDYGFYGGSIDGDFGFITASAVMAFQTSRGLYVDGIVGPVTIAALSDSQSKTLADNDTASAADESETGIQLSRGMYGSEVSDLQTMLSHLGYYSDNIDGSFGPLTENAVIAFQQAEGLAADGIADSITLETLKKASETSVSQPQKTPADTADTNTDANAADTTNTAATDNSEEPAEDNTETSATDNSREPAEDNTETSATDNSREPAEDNTETSATDNSRTPAEDNTETSAADNSEAPAADNSGTSAEDNSGTPATDNSGTPADAGPVLTAVCNAPDGLRIDWEKTAGAASYRVFRLAADGSWKAIADTGRLYYIDTSVVSGNRYTYTVKALDSDGNIVGDFNQSGLSFTYTYYYDTLLASAPASVSRKDLLSIGKTLGMDSDEVKAVIGWVEGEGYVNIDRPYMAYLSACVVINGILDGVYERGQALIEQIETWGSYFSAEALKSRYENASSSTLLAVYLAMQQRPAGIYFCRGANSKPAGCFYDPGLDIQGQHVYVW